MTDGYGGSTRACEGCGAAVPHDRVLVSTGDTTVQQSLTDQMILDWMGQHFVDGAPA